jgi:uncharacterized protein with HEPN domain
MKRKLDPRSRAVLYDLLESARSIQEYIEATGRQAFLENALLQDAVCMRLMVIGELAGKLDISIKGFPLQAMKGLRNRIAHDYGRVDLAIVWKIAHEEMDPIVEKLEDLLHG